VIQLLPEDNSCKTHLTPGQCQIEREEPEPATARSLPTASQKRNHSLHVKHSTTVRKDAKKNMRQKKYWRSISEDRKQKHRFMRSKLKRFTDG